MRLVRFLDPDGRPGVGVQTGERIAELDRSIADVLTLRVAAARELLEGSAAASTPVTATRMLAPIDGNTEVWAAGVTYRQSQQARMLESEQSADIYHRVYDAVRPELFFESTAWRVVGPDSPIAVRPDSAINVPEPELALVCNAFGEIVGFTVCNDVSSRSIEGENPLYLPQAKVYLGGCALGPGIVPSWEIDDPYRLGIDLEIDRGGSSGLGGIRQHLAIASAVRRPGRAPLPRRRLSVGRGHLDRHLPGSRAPVHPATGRFRLDHHRGPGHLAQSRGR